MQLGSPDLKGSSGPVASGLRFCCIELRNLFDNKNHRGKKKGRSLKQTQLLPFTPQLLPFTQRRKLPRNYLHQKYAREVTVSKV